MIIFSLKKFTLDKPIKLGYEEDIHINSFPDGIDSKIITSSFDIYEPDTEVQQLSE